MLLFLHSTNLEKNILKYSAHNNKFQQHIHVCTITVSVSILIITRKTETKFLLSKYYENVWKQFLQHTDSDWKRFGMWTEWIGHQKVTCTSSPVISFGIQN